MKFQQGFSQRQEQTQKQVQKFVLTQQLQQSIQILQYSTEELRIYIENEALENPLIELVEVHDLAPNERTQNYQGEESDYLTQIPDTSQSLFESLIEQIHLNYRATYLRTLVLYLVEYIDLNGFLTISLEEAAEQTGGSLIQMLDALTLIQQLDPAGVGARNLQESLMLQTERDNHAPALAYLILEESFDALVDRKWEDISKRIGVSLQEIQKVFDYIQHLSPTPGAIFSDTRDLYIVPDLTVKEVAGKLLLVSNKRSMPEIKFQTHYFNQMAQSGDEEVTQYLKEKQQNFEMLKKMIEQRGNTIYRVGQFILTHQEDFFLDGRRPLKPLILKEVAQSLDLHESTISRAVNGKYLATDFGVFELKHFFRSKIVSKDGEESSTDEVKNWIQRMIQEENKQKPLSDQKIVDLLGEKGFKISRRTVAKYREQLGIPGSTKRKRYD
ncbi:RNA polymerase factor sigma-54 [Enterococcus sp. LJL98]